MRNDHPNSKESYQQKKVEDLVGLHMLIYLVYRQNRSPLTDRQVKGKLDLDDMNNVRPRITELIDDRLLRDVGSTRDEKTGRTVRLVTVNYCHGEQTRLW